MDETEVKRPGNTSSTEVTRYGLFDIGASIVRRLPTIIGVSMGAGVLAVVVTLLGGTTYLADAQVKPHLNEAGAAPFAGLAAQFGVNMGAALGGESLDFYVALLTSRDLLEEAVRSEYPVAEGGRSRATLVEIYKVDKEDPDERTREAVAELRNNVSVSRSLESGLIGLRVTAETPDRAEGIAARLLELLGEFNREKRSSQAASERRFVEERLTEAEAQLREAERDLQEFLSANRSIGDSPQLTFERARLQRRVDLRQQLYLSLAQAHQQARIEEIRNTPVMTVVNSPQGSARPAESLLFNGALGIVLGGFMAVLVVLAIHAMSSHRKRDPDGYRELTEAVSTVISRGGRQ